MSLNDHVWTDFIWISKLQQNLINHTIWSACLHFRQRNMLEYFDEKKFFIVFIAS